MIRIPTKTHGIMDLVMGATFLAAPFILNALNDNSNGRSNGKKKKNKNNGNYLTAENIALPAMGASIIAQGLLTDHELGAVKALDMKTHLLTDLALGGLMVASPWLLKMDKKLSMPLVAMGAATIGMALITHLEPGYEQFDDLDGIDEPETLLEEIEEQF